MIARARVAPDSAALANMTDQMLQGKTRKAFANSNTTLVVAMTNALLTKVEAAKMAQMAQDGLARAVRPVHTQFDGDLVFALSIGQKKVGLNTVGTAAAEVTAEAIVRGAKLAKGLGNIPAWKELGTGRWKTESGH